VPARRNAHASRSDDTFVEEIVVPAATRVLARSPFGYAQVPLGVDAPVKVLVVGFDWLDEDPHAASSTVATAAAAVCDVNRVLMCTACPFRP
jgi:hypothetical protein